MKVLLPKVTFLYPKLIDLLRRFQQFLLGLAHWLNKLNREKKKSSSIVIDSIGRYLSVPMKLLLKMFLPNRQHLCFCHWLRSHQAWQLVWCPRFYSLRCCSRDSQRRISAWNPSICRLSRPSTVIQTDSINSFVNIGVVFEHHFFFYSINEQCLHKIYNKVQCGRYNNCGKSSESEPRNITLTTSLTANSSVSPSGAISVWTMNLCLFFSVGSKSYGCRETVKHQKLFVISKCTWQCKYRLFSKQQPIKLLLNNFFSFAYSLVIMPKDYTFYTMTKRTRL